MHEDWDGPEHDVPMTISFGSSSVHNPKPDMEELYSIDRMTSTRVWRTENTDADEMNVMNATSWKSEAQRRNDRIGDQAYNKISAPDAQLVYFLDHYFHRDWGRRDFDLVARYRGGNNRYVLKRSVLFPREGDQSVPLLLGDGTMAYIKRDTDWGYAHCVNGGRASYLLGRPIDELMRRVENLERKALKRKRKMFEDEEDKIEDQDHDMDSKEVDLEASDIPKTDWLETRPNEISKESSRLWVDKYAPNNFSDLLSDEKINREVLRALHEWDPFVFRKNPPARPVNTDWVQGNKGYRKDNHTTAGKVVRAFKQYALDGESEEQGEHSTNEKARDIRPALEKRVILLSGPPGVGKTTMAHIIARHAGYRPVEVNASDERTASVLKERVLRAMESSTLAITSESINQKPTLSGILSNRPNCLILDEIDGADAQSSVSTLVDIIRGEIPPKKGRATKPFLRRPIIFICNNKYAAALRPLLPYAQQFEVSPPLTERLISRLRSVLSAEGLSVNGGSSLLNQLVLATGGDIRSCLFSLQFASARAKATTNSCVVNDSKKHHQNSLVDISSVILATLDGTQSLKDDRSDVIAMLSAIFRKQSRSAEKQKAEYTYEIDRILNLVDSFGDNTKALDLMYSNMVEVPFIDPMFDRCWSALEWLSYSDIFRSFKTQLAMTNTVDHHHLQKLYISTAGAAVHFLCGIEKRPNLNFSSRTMLDAVFKAEAHVGLIGKYMDGLSPRLRATLFGVNPVTELIPYILWLLSAGNGNSGLHRAVSNIEMLTKNERLSFQRQIDLLIVLGLTYVKVDRFEASSSSSSHFDQFRLDPDIGDLMSFKDTSNEVNCRRNEIPPALKQLLAHAVIIQRVKDRGEHGDIDVGVKRPEVVEKHKPIIDDGHVKNEIGPKNFLGALAAKTKAVKYSKTISIEKSVPLSNTGSGVPLDSVVKFKYQKGFTQAVRMPCSRKDFQC